MKEDWSHRIKASDITRDGMKLSITPDDAARAAVCERLELIGIETLNAELSLIRLQDGCTIEVTGHLTASVTPACVATLEPVPAEVDEEIEGFYLDNTQTVSFTKARHAKDIEAGDPEMLEREMPDEREEPEPVVDGAIDVAELVVQHLSLALPPFPHAQDAEKKLAAILEKHGGKSSPFDVLKTIKGG